MMRVWRMMRFRVRDTVSAAIAVSGVGYGRLPDGIATLGKNSLKSAQPSLDY
ncbi:hypothetical protein [Paenibacillus odorifer]|uniref:hypothetical protein n=1 Tax=Paenibacillus odorifer TaxID=189426 RepID=UPI001C4C887A|nr:hypothetical protein [Paenibacillus odorifer]